MKFPALPPPFGKRRPRQISVREAWLDPDRYAAQPVCLLGTVRAFDLITAAPYFTLDDGPQRVGLHADAATLGSRVGQRVRVTGQLTFKPGVGIFLAVATIETA